MYRYLRSHTLSFSRFGYSMLAHSCLVSCHTICMCIYMERITIFVLFCKHRLIIIFPRLASNITLVRACVCVHTHTRSCSCFLFLTFKTAWIHISKLLGLTFHRRFVESLICSFIILIRLKWNSNIQDISTQQRKRQTEVEQHKEEEKEREEDDEEKNSHWIFDSYLDLISLPFFLSFFIFLPFDVEH